METNFLVKARFVKEFTDGTLKVVSHPYLIGACNFTEAEARVYKEIGNYTRGEFVVTAMAKQDFADIFYYDDAEVWYKARVDYVSEDADSGKEKRISNHYLVTAHKAAEAIERIKDSLKGLMVTFDITKIERTKIVEWFPFEPMETTSDEEGEGPDKINVAGDFKEEE